MNWYVYIIQSATGKLYTGMTNDLVRRLDQHNGKRSGGARYTRTDRPWRLVYSEEQVSKVAALRREHAIKRFTRTKKLDLVGKFVEPALRG